MDLLIATQNMGFSPIKLFLDADLVVKAVIIGLDQTRQRPAFTQRHDVPRCGYVTNCMLVAHENNCR